MKNHYLLLIAGILISAVCAFLAYIEFIASEFTPKTSKNLKGVDDQIQKVLYYASLAPSSHNAQMWKVKINPSINTIYITLDDSRTLKVIDKENRESYISIGCYVKALEMAFKAFNYKTITTIQEESKQVLLTFLKDNTGDINHAILNSLTKRHSDKQIFTDRMLDKDLVTKLSAVSDNVILVQKKDKSYNDLTTLIKDTVKRQSYDKMAVAELASYMRFSDDESKEKQDGLNAEQLGLRGLKKFFYYLFVNSSTVLTETFSKQTVSIINKQIDSAPAFVLLESYGDDFKSKVIHGMELMELWMFLTDNNVEVHPISAPIEYKDSINRINKILNKQTDTDMILRVGYAEKYLQNHRLRRNLDKYIEVVKD
ncbi:hypothetical protein [Succinivibrio sp.]|uniref:hypothetical protein n=1 Tax=Succinivibrio sp. TaxID=2053619 RepID=UPI003862D8E2